MTLAGAAAMQESLDQALARAQGMRLAGKPGEAAEIYRQILRGDAKAAAARRALGSLPDAVLAPPPAGPAEHQALTRLQADLAQGKWARVVEGGQKLMARLPRHAAIPEAMGLALVQMGRIADATRAFNHAIRVDPAHKSAYINLATTLRMTGQIAPAAEAVEAALQLDPDDPNALATQGLLADDRDQPEAAEAAFRKALEHDPGMIAAHDGLCRLYEKSNQISDLERAVDAGLAAAPGAPELRLRKAQLQFRCGEHRAAIETLTAIDTSQLRPESQAMRQELLGKAHDYLGEAGDAFAAFAEMNKITKVRQSPDAIEKNPFQAAIDHRLRGTDDLDPARWLAPPLPEGSKTPAFLVGFPRSGTTLLDTILRGHDGIVVAEEKPMMQNMGRNIAPEAEAQALSALTDSDIAALRESYFAEYEREAGDAIGPRLPIDKMPLNMSEAAIIRRVFPGARFILALRHPCDCVLSCFMQNFQVNAAMNSFLTLESAARTYDRVFTLFEAYRERLALEVIQIRYEDVIADMRATTEPLFAFLGLPWSDKVLDTQKTAKSRGKIKTSSYRQVTQKIYTSADGRWRRYENHLAPILPVLEPWIEKWDYAA